MLFTPFVVLAMALSTARADEPWPQDDLTGTPGNPDTTDDSPVDEDPFQGFVERIGGLNSAIINGVDATADDYPMAGAMIMQATYRQGSQSMQFRVFLCSSTLIAPDTVLLAAHCVDEDTITGGYGTLDIEEIGWTRQADVTDYAEMAPGPLPDWPADTVFAWDWLRHERYTGQFALGLAQNWDIGMLFLDTPITDVPHAYLATPEEVPQITTGVELGITGWGQQTSDQNPPTGTYAIKQMGMSSISELAQWEFQVGLAPTDVRKCHGDSGGPSFMWVDTTTYTESMRLIGVTSHAYDMSDCRRTGGVDTRIDEHFTWIEEQMTSRCADNSRAWCDEPGMVPPPLPIPVDTGDSGLDDDKKTIGEKCGCAASSGPRGLGALLLLAPLVLVRRRRENDA